MRVRGFAGQMVLAAALWLTCGMARASAEVLVNVALPAYGTRVTADTHYDERYNAAKAADGCADSNDSCWFSRDGTELPCAITFRLGADEEIRRVVLHQARWNGSMYHTRQFAVEVSGDGQTWTRLGTGELADHNDSRAVLDVRARARWLRVVVLSSYIPLQTCGFAEVEILAAGHPGFGAPELRLNGQPAPPPTASMSGLAFVAGKTGPQVALFSRPASVLVSVCRGEDVLLSVPVSGLQGRLALRAHLTLREGSAAQVEMTLDGAPAARRVLSAGQGRAVLEVRGAGRTEGGHLRLRTRTPAPEAAVHWQRIELVTPQRRLEVPLNVAAPEPGSGPPPPAPILRPALERASIEWDWRLQDGIGTERKPVALSVATQRVLQRGQRLVDDLMRSGLGPRLRRHLVVWNDLKRAYRTLAAGRAGATEAAWEALYLRAHWLRRRIALANPLANVGPLLFVKQVPPCFSHQLTQYYGRYARPGGGLFVLDRPGLSMRARQLAPGSLAVGSYMHPEVSYAGDRILFAYCRAETTPTDTVQGHHGRYYHLYEMRADGTRLRQLTDGPFNDFSPRYLPDGRLLFISTRRRGWHRCGNPGCENYTLATANADGSGARPLSFHETQEWDPAVLNDGRIIYTRWDYVDRHPVFYEHLWTAYPDGTRPAAFFGNNTFNPIGIWEPRPVPGSDRVMATAGAHHAMTAGSIVLVDGRMGVDGRRPLIRLTPDAPFPESETRVGGTWHYPMPGTTPHETEESQRWPGHCYRSPYPLSETYFLAAYSFQGLLGEPHANPANMFGLYLVDAFGNKELLYRDPSIASLWPIPLRPRRRPPVRPSSLDASLGKEGVFLVQDVYASAPSLPRGSVKALRVVQVLPKSTPGIDMPPVGRPRGAPGRQVLGTVPVEADGSAYFRAPAGVEMSFHALDERGLALQIMRSGVYLQPGERVSCAGCHEQRTSGPLRARPLSLNRPPSRITPGPSGSKPFSYPLLVQPVLDRHCVSCHSGGQPAGGVSLTGTPEGHYTTSYHLLSARVPFSDLDNIEPLSRPGRFGALGSPVMAMLLAGHQGVRLNPEEIERLATWMDTTALFYGTFDPADQARQQRGEQIAGPQLE